MEFLYTDVDESFSSLAQEVVPFICPGCFQFLNPNEVSLFYIPLHLPELSLENLLKSCFVKLESFPLLFFFNFFSMASSRPLYEMYGSTPSILILSSLGRITP